MPIRSREKLQGSKVQTTRGDFPPAPPGALDIRETARLLGVSLRTVHRRIASGELRPMRVGRGRGKFLFFASRARTVRARKSQA